MADPTSDFAPALLANQLPVVVSSSVAATVGIYAAGVLVGTRPGINLVGGNTVTVTVADNPGTNRVDVTITGPAITTTTLAGGPPGSPADKDQWIATAVDANGTRWAFQYNSGGGANKWEFFGGSAQAFYGGMIANLTPAATWVSVKTLTIARAGDYQVRGGFRFTVNGTAAHAVSVGVAAGAAGASNQGQVTFPAASNGSIFSIETEDRVTLTAGQTLYLSGSSSSTTGGTDATADGYLAVVPVRIA